MYSNSYGPVTDGTVLQSNILLIINNIITAVSVGPTGTLSVDALTKCRTQGRGGKGNIFLFSAGNDGDSMSFIIIIAINE